MKLLEVLIEHGVIDQVVEDFNAGFGLLVGGQALEAALHANLHDGLAVDGCGYTGRRLSARGCRRLRARRFLGASRCPEEYQRNRPGKAMK